VKKPQLRQSQGRFTAHFRVEVTIAAAPERVWSLLTDAKDFPRWNSMIVRIDGEMRKGERLRLHVPGSDRTSIPMVSTFVPNRRMVWTRGLALMFKGERTFELEPRGDGSTTFFCMEERISGLLLPLTPASTPNFGPILVRFANDLRNEAQRRTPVGRYR